MVVPVETDFSRALTKPLDVVQELSQASAAAKDADAFPALVAEHFGKVLPGRDELRKVC